MEVESEESTAAVARRKAQLSMLRETSAAERIRLLQQQLDDAESQGQGQQMDDEGGANGEEESGEAGDGEEGEGGGAEEEQEEEFRGAVSDVSVYSTVIVKMAGMDHVARCTAGRKGGKITHQFIGKLRPP